MPASRLLISAMSLLLLAMESSNVQANLLCQNGGAFVRNDRQCMCTAQYYGQQCELAFMKSDPCANLSSVQLLHDRAAIHRIGNRRACRVGDKDCIDFSSIFIDWYRLVSPAGGNLISQCPNNSLPECGSSRPYILMYEVPEPNSNRILSRARAVRYWKDSTYSCYHPRHATYPVRILKCSVTVTLYYLRPLSSEESHYCIGDKQQCGTGFKSVDGSGFEPCINTQICSPRRLENAVEPRLLLNYNVKPNGNYIAAFNCTVFPAFASNRSEADNVRYLVEYQLNFRNGTSVLIPECQQSDVSIDAGQSKTFQCKSTFVLTGESNVYGGSLVCRVQARCNTAGSQYNSVQIESNSHGFYFKYGFNGGSDVIKPNEPITLCINSDNIPVRGEVTFAISLGRQQIMPSDEIFVSVVRRVGCGSLECKFKMKYQEKSICMDITLYNHDPDNRVPSGLRKADQIRFLMVDISYRTSADGLYSENGASLLHQIQSIPLKVDMTGLQTQVKTYLHIVLGKSKQMEKLAEDTCQANCFIRGSCISGQCAGDDGSYETAPAASPTEKANKTTVSPGAAVRPSPAMPVLVATIAAVLILAVNLCPGL